MKMAAEPGQVNSAANCAHGVNCYGALKTYHIMSWDAVRAVASEILVLDSESAQKRPPQVWAVHRRGPSF